MPGLLRETSTRSDTTASSSARQRGTNGTAQATHAPPRTTNSATSTRLPGAPASLRVQMPVAQLMAEREAALAARGSAGGARGFKYASTGGAESSRGFRPTRSGSASASASGSGAPSRPLNGTAQAQAANGASPAAPTDAQILTSSVLGQREQARSTLAWQERLMDEEGVKLDVLREALTHLSTATWLQVLQERQLATVCAYPTCSNPPSPPQRRRNSASPSPTPSSPTSLSSTSPSATTAHPHAALRAAAARALPASAPRYRISLRTRTVTRDTAADPGGRATFCSDACWRRAEWVRRWVLGGSKGGAQERTSAAAPSGGLPARTGEAERDPRGGRWEALINNGLMKDWRSVELLEDIEAQNDANAESEAGSSTAGSSAIRSRSPLQDGPAVPASPRTATAVAGRSLEGSRNKVEELIAQLTITEHPPGAKARAASAPRTSRPASNGDTSVSSARRPLAAAGPMSLRSPASTLPEPTRKRGGRAAAAHLDVLGLFGHGNRDDDDDDDDHGDARTSGDAGDTAHAAEELARVLLGANRSASGTVPSASAARADSDSEGASSSDDSDSDVETPAERQRRRAAEAEEDRAFEHAFGVRDALEAGGVRVRGEPARARHGEVL